MDPAALSIDDLEKLLTKAQGKQLPRGVIEQHLEAGAPQNPDGTIHLIHYTAWLAGQVS